MNYHFEGHLSEWRNISDNSWICLHEITEGTEKKVNHYITFYMYNPILQLSLRKPSVSIIVPNLCPTCSNL